MISRQCIEVQTSPLERPSAHAMRNEQALSSEVASDETLLYRWLRHEGGSSCRALVGYRRRETMGVKSTHDSCPPDSLRGRCCLLKKASCVGHSSEGARLSRKAGTRAILICTRGGPKPAEPRQPVLPTKALAPTSDPGRTRRRFCLRQRLRQWKHLHILSPKVGLSTCDEARSLLSPCARFIKRTAKGKGIESHKTAAMLVLWLSWEHPSCSEKQHVMLANPSDVTMFPGSVKQDPVRAELEERLDSHAC